MASLKLSQFDYQIEDAKYILASKKFALCHEPGVGKTFGDMLAIQHLVVKEGIKVLVVVPPILISTWYVKFNEYFNHNLVIVKYIGTKSERKKLINNLHKADIVICSYDKFEEYIKYLKSGNTIIDSLINKNDVVKIIEVFNQMADFTTAQVNIIPNSHYAYKDGFIHLDIESIYPLFAKYNKDYNLGLFDPGYVSFMKMLQKESFCATLGRATTIGDRVKVIATLDYNKMKQLDIACTNLVPKENQ